MASGLGNGIAQAVATALKKATDKSSQALSPLSPGQGFADNANSAAGNSQNGVSLGSGKALFNNQVPALMPTSTLAKEGEQEKEELPDSDVVDDHADGAADVGVSGNRSASGLYDDLNRYKKSRGLSLDPEKLDAFQSDVADGIASIPSKVESWLSKDAYQRANEASEKWKSGEEEYKPISDKVGEAFTEAALSAADSPAAEFLYDVAERTGNKFIRFGKEVMEDPGDLAGALFGKGPYHHGLLDPSSFNSHELSDDETNGVYESVFNSSYTPSFTPNEGVKTTNQDVIKELDGGVTEDSRYGAFMTGEQYIRYREAGIPGRPVDDIDPNGFYSKTNEQNEYGFIPYVTEDNYHRMNQVGGMVEVSDAWTKLGNLRDYYTDYTINYNGKQISGNDFEKHFTPFSSSLDQYQDESLIVDDPSLANEDARPYVGKWTINLDGEDPLEFRGAKKDLGFSEFGDVVKYEGDPRVHVYLDNDYENPENHLIFDDEEDWYNSVSFEYVEPAEGEEPNYWGNWENLYLDDGTMLTPEEAVDIWLNTDNYVDDYGFLNWGKPSRLIEQPFENGHIPDMSETLPWLTDLALNSAAYTLPGLLAGKFGKANPITWLPYALNAGPRAWLANQVGLDGYSFNPRTGTYNRLSDELTDEQIMTSTIANLAQPLIEELGGISVGGGFNKIADKLQSEIGKLLVKNGFGEALEEAIPGQIGEEGLNYTLGEAFANPMLDENGEPIYDSQGHEMRDEDTPLIDRLRNFASGAPTAGTQGFALGTAVGTANLPAAVANDAVRKATAKTDKENGYENAYKVIRPTNIKFDFDEDVRRKYGE